MVRCLAALLLCALAAAPAAGEGQGKDLRRIATRLVKAGAWDGESRILLPLRLVLPDGTPAKGTIYEVTARDRGASYEADEEGRIAVVLDGDLVRRRPVTSIRIKGGDAVEFQVSTSSRSCPGGCKPADHVFLPTIGLPFEERGRARVYYLPGLRAEARLLAWKAWRTGEPLRLLASGEPREKIVITEGGTCPVPGGETRVGVFVHEAVEARLRQRGLGKEPGDRWIVDGLAEWASLRALERSGDPEGAVRKLDVRIAEARAARASRERFDLRREFPEVRGTTDLQAVSGYSLSLALWLENDHAANLEDLVGRAKDPSLQARAGNYPIEEAIRTLETERGRIAAEAGRRWEYSGRLTLDAGLRCADPRIAIGTEAPDLLEEGATVGLEFGCRDAPESRTARLETGDAIGLEGFRWYRLVPEEGEAPFPEGMSFGLRVPIRCRAIPEGERIGVAVHIACPGGTGIVERFTLGREDCTEFRRGGVEDHGMD